MSDSQPQIISEVQVAPAPTGSRESSAFALGIVGLVLAAIALPCAFVGYGLYALLASSSWRQDPASAFVDPFFVSALIGTLLPTGLSALALYLGISVRANRSTTVAGVGLGLALLGVLIVLGSTFGLGLA